MRIAHFIDTDTLGGAETLAVDLCRLLNERGHDSVLLHFGNPHLNALCRRHGLCQQVLPGHALYKSFRTLPRFAPLLRDVLRDQGVQLLHSHLFGPIVAAAPAALLAGVPHVGTLHDVHVVAERPLRARLLQLATLLGTRLVAVSEHMAEFYRRRTWFAPGRLRTIHNGVALTSPPRDRQLRAALGLGEEELAAICVARLVPLKRHEDLLRAFALLRPPAAATLLLAGDGPLRPQLQQTAAALELSERVRFLGNRDDIPALLAASDLFVLASETEGLSRSLLEAMAAGLPAVVTRVGGNPELVSDGETGFLVPTGDVAALGERLQTLLDDPALRAAMGAQARARAESRFSADAMLRAYLALYTELTSTAGGRRRRAPAAAASQPDRSGS